MGKNCKLRERYMRAWPSQSYNRSESSKSMRSNFDPSLLGRSGGRRWHRVHLQHAACQPFSNPNSNIETYELICIYIYIYTNKVCTQKLEAPRLQNSLINTIAFTYLGTVMRLHHLHLTGRFSFN